MKKIQTRLFIGLALGLACILPAGAVSVTNTRPRGWDFNGDTNTSVGVEFDAAPAGPVAFKLHSRWRGLRSGTLTVEVNRVDFTPDEYFLPGEPLEATVGADGSNFTWRFQTAPQGGSATLITNSETRVIHSGGAYNFRNIALADLNGNQTLEVIAPALNKSRVILAWGNPAVTTSVVLAGAIQDVAAADLNSDGQPDWVLGCATQMLVVALNTGDGLSYATAAQTVGGVSGPLRQVAIGDLNGDGAPDALAIAETSKHLIPFINNGSGGLVAGSPIPLSFTPYGLEAGDVDGDGDVDGVVVGISGNVALLLNDGSGMLQTPIVHEISNQALYTCRLADFNRDGQADLVAAGAGGVVFVGLGGPSGLVFSEVEHTWPLSTIYSVGVGDFDVDGWPDLVTCGGDYVAILIGTGTGFLSYLEPVTLPGELLRDVEVGDRNQDGRLDATVCGLATGAVYTLWNSPASWPVVLGTNQEVIVNGAAPALSAGTDFGSQSLLTSATNTLLIANRGLGVLHIDPAAITGAQASAFQVVGLPAEVQPGVTSAFQVVFSPAQLGMHQAELQITNNSPVTSRVSPYRIPLAGFGAKKPVNQLTLENTNAVYDGTAHGVTVTVDPAVTVQITYDGQTNAPVAAGLYTVVATVDDLVYGGSVTGVLDLGQRPLSVLCQDAVRGYGDPDPDFAYTLTNFVGSEGPPQLTSLPSMAALATSNSPVGTYVITGSGGVASNYAFVFSNATLTITQVTLTVRAEDQSRHFGETNPPLTLVYTGFRNGETEAVLAPATTADTLATVNSPVGTYPITVSGGAATNYHLIREDGVLTVFGSLAQVVLTNLLQTYDGTPRSVTVITLPPDLPTRVTYDGATLLPSNAGTYTVVGTITNPNYSGSATATLTVVKGDQTLAVFNPASGAYPSEQIITLTATGSPSGNPITYEIISGPGLLVAADQLRFTGPGWVSVRAWQNGNANWNASPPVTNRYEPFDTNRIHYAALAGQVPQWPFASEGTAASNIQDAVDVAAEGDDVRVGPGVYAAGGRVGPGTLTNRVVIDKALRVQSSSGPAVTTIQGQPAGGSEAPLGAAALRCVYLTNNAELIGFTLTQGFTAGTNAAWLVDQRGGGALLASGAVLKACAVTGNGAVYGGGLFGGAAVQTRLTGNQARFEGGGAAYAVLNDGLLTGNQARYGGGAFRSSLSSCTVADNAADNGGGVYEGMIENSISWYNTGHDVLGALAQYVCASSGVIHATAGCRTNAPLFADRAAGNYALSHYSPGVNAGNTALLLTNGWAGSRYDLPGQDRILHGIPDLGAFEYNGVPGDPEVRAPGEVQAHQFLARWNPPATSVPFQVYRLELTNRTATAAALFATASVSQTQRLLSELQPGTEYAYRVRTENEFSNSAWSGWMSVTTLTEGAIDVSSGLVFTATYGGANPAPASLRLANDGQTALAWTNTLTFAGGTGSWLTVHPAGGQLDAGAKTDLLCSISIGGLNAGTYTATARVASATATNSPVERPVQLILERGGDLITFSGTNRVYSGSPLSVEAHSAHGQPVQVTYNGVTNLPTDAGVYAVVGTVETLNWTGSNSTRLTISKAPQSIAQFLPASGSFPSTNILTLSATGGGSGYPVLFSRLAGPAVLLPGNQLRFTGYGEVWIEATQAGDANWEPAPARTNHYTVIPAPNLVHYVAQAGQTSVWPYAAWDQAASNLQDAADAAWDGDRIRVAPGIYAVGGRAAPGLGLVNRLYLSRTVSVESVAGPEQTMIEGHRGADAGFGADAVRCAFLTNGASLSGFTLRSGATLGRGDLLQDRAGGAVLLYPGCRVSRCILADNQALDYGGGAFLLQGGEVESCLVVSNTAGRGAGLYLFQGGVARNSTVADNAAAEYAGGIFLLETGEVVNSISWYNTAGLGGNNLWASGAGPVIRYTCAPDGLVDGTAGCRTNAPGFVNRPSGDYHLATNSICRGAGLNAAALGDGDLDGEPRRVDTVEIGMDEVIEFLPPRVLPPEAVTPLAFRARWEAANTLPMSHYVLVLEETGSGSVRFSNSVGTATVRDFNGLSEGLEYRYRVLGETLYGPTPWSDWMVVTTLQSAVLQGLTNMNVTMSYGAANPTGILQHLTNSGVGACVWSNQTLYAGGASGWLSWVPAAGVVPGGGAAAIQAHIEGQGINAGLYIATNRIQSAALTNGPVEFVVYLNVLKMEQTIDFPYPAVIGLHRPVMLAATVSSGRPVQYSLVSGPATLVSNRLTATGFGRVTVRAAELGDANHQPAAAVEVTLTVGGNAHDFDGDGFSDLAVYDPVKGLWFIRGQDGTVLEWGTRFGYAGTQGVSGDFNGDGLRDFGVFDPARGLWFIREQDGTSLAWGLNWGYPGVIPVSGDYDGDGADDLAIFDPATGRWFIRTLAGAVLAWDLPWGYPGVVPVPGDYDGDGRHDLAIYDEGAGRWYIRAVAGPVLAWAQQWGYAGASAVFGDYNGDGAADLAVFDPLSGRWYIRALDTTLIGWGLKWGYRGSWAVPGDYNGDGAFDLGIYDPQTGKWYVQSVTGTILLYGVEWGYFGAVPVVY